MRFSPVRGVDLIPDTVCKSRWCRQILSRLRADLRENPIKQWASRDALIQSAGSISDSARYHSDANIALGPILKMYIPGQIRIFNALNSDGYSTGNAPPSGNNENYADDNHLYNKNVCVENLLDDLVNDANAAVTWFHENHMVANPEKFQSILLSRNGGVCIPISVQNNDLCPTNNIRVLGVTLDERLNFKSHVDYICNRASRQINSFKRFSKYLKIDRRLSVYKSFIQSNFSYCPVAWLFCGRQNSNKLEKLQERAIRIVFDDFSSSYELLCERANTLPLSCYRLRFLGIEMYKCIKETNSTYLNDLFCEQASDYQLRDSSRLIQSILNTFKFGSKSFRYFGAKLWNVLPVDIKQSESLSMFKTRITKWCYSDAAKALEEKMFWLPHYIISTIYSKWCPLYSNFILGFSLPSACFLPL